MWYLEYWQSKHFYYLFELIQLLNEARRGYFLFLECYNWNIKQNTATEGLAQLLKRLLFSTPSKCCRFKSHLRQHYVRSTNCLKTNFEAVCTSSQYKLSCANLFEFLKHTQTNLFDIPSCIVIYKYWNEHNTSLLLLLPT